MCGFTGFFAGYSTAKRSTLRDHLQSMVKTLTHRGPDHGGAWQDPDVNLALGHRRLSILDLSSEGHQPMHSASGRYVFVYNGEVYNFQNLAKNLSEKGVSLRGRSDSEAVLETIDRTGLNQTLQKMGGMFAFALWDRTEKELHFARDRMGKKPLYVGWAGKTLVFGSELKALCAHPQFKREINSSALALYMRNGYISAPYCIYKNVWSLPPGFRLTVKPEDLKPGEDISAHMVPYWHHMQSLRDSRVRMMSGDEEAVTNQFESLLKTCVEDRMVSDVPLGAFLSGGIDSSCVAALMQNASDQKIKTYTIGFKEIGFNEAEHATKIAAHLGCDHHELYLSAGDAMDVIPALPEFYDEPFADISAIPTYLVSKFARGEVTVALSGDGGDEMLGGYNRHTQGPKLWARMKLLPKPARMALANFLTSVPAARWSQLVPQKPQFGIAVHKAASILTLDDPKSIYDRLTAQWYQNPVLESDVPATLLEDFEWQVPHDLSFAEQMMVWDVLSYLPGDILTKVDRASMAVGLEVRAPLLDWRVYDFVWSLPESYKIRGGKGKYLLRKVLERYVPNDLFERPKQGFTMPVGEWLRGPLRDWAEELLDEKKLEGQGHLDAAMIRHAWDEHLAGRGQHELKLWTALMFQAWHAHWIEG